MPALDAASVKLYLVTIGTPQVSAAAAASSGSGTNGAGPASASRSGTAETSCCLDAAPRITLRQALVPFLVSASRVSSPTHLLASASPRPRPALPQSGVDFASQTGFPPDRLLADPENACYEVLQFRRGLRATFFDPATPAAIKARMRDGGDADLKQVLKVGGAVAASCGARVWGVLFGGRGRAGGGSMCVCPLLCWW